MYKQNLLNLPSCHQLTSDDGRRLQSVAGICRGVMKEGPATRMKMESAPSAGTPAPGAKTLAPGLVPETSTRSGNSSTKSRDLSSWSQILSTRSWNPYFRSFTRSLSLKELESKAPDRPPLI